MHPRKNSWLKWAWIVVFVLCHSIPGHLDHPRCLARAESYPSITGPCGLEFPRDHGPHPEHRIEWWYYTGNLHSRDGRRLGFQLTFFRAAVSPPGSRAQWPPSPSAWRSRQIYLAHAAVSDLNEKRFYHSDGMAREALGMAGGRVEGDVTTIYFKDWSATIEKSHHILQARSPDFHIRLTLVPLKPPIPHGNGGHSIKGKSPESSSCYYSLTRLMASGSIELNGELMEVSGTAWMDHEFSSAPLEEDIQGWDWFSLQFTDQSELMVYLMRHPDGSFSGASGGTYVTASAEATSLSAEAVDVQILDHWRSPRSKTVYPSGWRLKVPPLHLDLTVTPNMRDQEMMTERSTGITYWEGSVSVEGTGTEGVKISGSGYVELTGYEESMGGRL